MLPVRQAGDDQLVDVVEDGLEGFALLGGGFGQGGLEVAGFDLGHYRAFTDGLAVVGDQVDQLVAVLAELFGGHARAPVVYPLPVPASSRACPLPQALHSF
ncbi:hypothetical protein D9M73_210490 [compost metagenome]